MDSAAFGEPRSGEPSGRLAAGVAGASGESTSSRGFGDSLPALDISI